MTWEEFKQYVDEKLEEQDLPQDVDINYIDVGSGTLHRRDIDVEFNNDELQIF